VTLYSAGFHVLPPTGGAKRNLVVEHNVIANLGSLANDDSGAVVDEESPPDFGSRMNLYTACEYARHLAYKPCQKRKLAFIEPVGNAMRPERMEAGIQQDFSDAFRGGILLKHYFDVFPHSGQYPVHQCFL
jgi:hypothetical protein